MADDKSEIRALTEAAAVRYGSKSTWLAELYVPTHTVVAVEQQGNKPAPDWVKTFPSLQAVKRHFGDFGVRYEVKHYNG